MSLSSILSWFPSSVELHKDLGVSKNITNVEFETECVLERMFEGGEI